MIGQPHLRRLEKRIAGSSLCSIFILMSESPDPSGRGLPPGPVFPAPDRPPGCWPRPPAALIAARLDEPPGGARVTVAGLVILRQRPGSARGVIFVTLEDETGVINVVIWRGLYERARRAVIAARVMRVTGRLQRAAGVVHVLAEEVEDISALLDLLPETGAPCPPDESR